ncbi:MAG: class I mannose-6-phosphate isomerase [Muribaculaceae bacterium]|nr:class I mannose-6-phosphate isomerase [Muribaculaceae bacterium]
MNSILLFNTYFKSVIWGGKRIAEFKGLPSQGSDIGESWELSPMPGHESVVEGGELDGLTLPEAIERYGKDIMGQRLMESTGGKFPLLVKFIDSNDDLSIQVHPDDELAAKRHNSLGKTEMWYSIAPAPGAYLYAGFSRRLTPSEYEQAVADNTIIEALAKYDTYAGDVFFLPAGRVHSIGRGNFVLEIQEASDVTYRIYDYGRIGADGKPRQLHLAESVDAIDFADVEGAAATHPVPQPDGSAELVHCSYFNTDLVPVRGSLHLDLAARDSFTIAISVKGTLTLRTPGGAATVLTQGRTALIPASLAEVDVEGEGEMVTVYIP